ncbi:phage tail protein [Candidatus Bandiella euplotis]|uniref:Phage tail domain protein n=1 Tax=Candidatus Bandiella euplotis TaxID=1664265 RepID=A0ABZ0UJS5_9RICK|nr:phage tail protein [Candidatus Bandiella woodruffii]WPX96353.1 Putative phage tail domain protein [Candidatus Bandiella woodruffii]
MHYIKQEHAFVITNVYAQDNNTHNKNHKNLNIPIVLQEAQAKDMVNKIMENVIFERVMYYFILPVSYMLLELGDIVEIEHNNQKHLIRILNIAITIRHTIEIFGVMASHDNTDSK